MYLLSAILTLFLKTDKGLFQKLKRMQNLTKLLILSSKTISKKKDESKRTMDEKLEKYRNQLIEIEQKVGESFLKTILTLSGGALGISFAFIKNVVGKGPIKASDTLIVAWTFLTISLASVLLSLYFGTLSYRHAITQVDKGKIYQQAPGGKLAKLMPILNFLSIFCFVSGVIFLFIFAFKNIGG